MAVSAFNLRRSLEATEAAWRANLDRLFQRMQFILGEQLAAFEKELAAAMRAPYAVGVGTGTAAIELALRAAGLGGSGGEVLTTAISAPFTATAILAAGCRPVFADVDPETLLIDPDDAGNRVGRRTVAIVPVHLYGQVCELDRLVRLAPVVVQDACQAHGVEYRGRPLTSWSPYVCQSFYPTKNLGCLGDGGAVLVRAAGPNARLRMLRDGGRRNGEQVARIAGINSRLDEMQCCYLRAFLPHLPEWNAHRALAAAWYDEALGDVEGVRIVARRNPSVHHLYVIRVKQRQRLRAHLAARGIGSGVQYPVPLHLNPAFAGGLKRGDLPVAEQAAREVLSLPLWPYIRQDEVLEVAEAVRAFFR